ncbi:MAG: LD-carboxypeptidase [Burkholderiaceae bacterium]
MIDRRRFTGALVASSVWMAGGQARAQVDAALPLLRAPRLKPGDTIALINPSGALYEREPYAIATETLQALGFKVREAPNLRARYGHLAGTDRQRADDVNAMFADRNVHGILAMTGGSGGNRMLPLVDYELIRRNPKVLGGFSDLTALINAVHAKTGLVTFHSPVGASEWNAFSVDHFKRMLMAAEAPTLSNAKVEEDALVVKAGRIATIRPGTARGPLLGGNLAVLTAMAGSPYWPSFKGAILVLEDTNEYIYRVDRMLSTLKIAGVLDALAGVVLGAFTNCEPGNGFGTLTLDEVFDDTFKPLGIPAWRGAQFGHIKKKWTLPIGLPVEIDAAAGTLRLSSAAVA